MKASPLMMAPSPSLTLLTDLPIVAETGIPVSASAAGPGVTSGMLHDIKAAVSSTGPCSGGAPGSMPAPTYSISTGAQKFESVAEEKPQLQVYSEAVQLSHVQPLPAPYETTEEEMQWLVAPCGCGPAGGQWCTKGERQ
ncbi:hypothetical protein B0H10DRAFT_1950093 [Mycena sp. CBHHK59/15]|nr:hypothetical protein B0H10DRAFT_1950093 [Mycena sp. CBHHK59/15]